jgi:RNA polymerase sigma-70 factor (ECF subfamily)
LATDEELMLAVAKGDPSALGELSGRYERPLYGFLHRAANGRDTEDLYQETWLHVVRAARQFDPARRFSTWLFQIALNLARDLHRRIVPQPLAPDALEAARADEPGTAQDLVDAALDLHRLLDALPAPQREVVLLRVLQDVSEEEAAAILDCPRGTVKSRLHHALERLAVLARQGSVPR